MQNFELEPVSCGGDIPQVVKAPPRGSGSSSKDCAYPPHSIDDFGLSLILCGFKYSGKTYFGKLLATRLGLPFIDTDRLIEAREGLSCSEIYRTRGETEFRRIEEEVVLSLSSTRSIIALGGGTPLNPRLIPHLQQLGRLVTLIPDLAVLKERFRTLKKPAYFETMTFEEMVEIRQPLYEKLPSHKVILVGKTEEEVLDLFCNLLCLKKPEIFPPIFRNCLQFRIKRTRRL